MSVSATPGGDYQLTGLNYTVVGGDAITVKASVTLLPSGLDVTAPQLQNYGVAVQQNLLPNATTHISFSTPQPLQWYPGAIQGQLYPVHPIATQDTIGLSQNTNDSVNEPNIFPYYDPPVKLVGGGQPTVATIKDTPGPKSGDGMITKVYPEPTTGQDAVQIGWMTLDQYTTSQNFADRGVLASLVGGVPLYSSTNPELGKQRFGVTGWSLNLDSNQPNQHASLATTFGGTAVDSPISNDSNTSTVHYLPTPLTAGTAVWFQYN